MEIRWFPGLVYLVFLAPALVISLDDTLDEINITSKEKQLVKKLLNRYIEQGKEGRPVVNTSDSIIVNFGVTLIQILDVDEKNQVLKMNIWYQYQWRDMLLTWNEADYDNIKDIRVPPEKIWLPDILLYNFADDRLREQRDALVVVQSNGQCLWMPQAILRSSCSFDTLYFPFDEQMCTLKFGSWTYDGFKLDIHFLPDNQAMNLNEYIKSNEWDIIENTGVRHEERYSCCPEPYPDITFKLRIKRKVAFYTFILIMPCALLSLLTLVIFWVPPESPAKLILGMNIFLAFFVLLLLLAESTPKAADSIPLIGMNIFLAFFLLLLLLAESTPKSAYSIPLIGAYFCLNMVMITMSTVLSCMVANMFFRGVMINRAPKWLRRIIIDGAARALCIRSKIVEPECSPPTPKKTWSSGRVIGETKGQYPYTDIRFAQVRLLDNGTDAKCANQEFAEPGVPAQQIGEDFNTQFRNGAGGGSGQILDEVRAIRDMLEKVKEKKAKVEEKEKYVREWRIIACVTDRLIFIFYLLVNIVGLGVIFLADLTPKGEDGAAVKTN